MSHSVSPPTAGCPGHSLDFRLPVCRRGTSQAWPLLGDSQEDRDRNGNGFADHGAQHPPSLSHTSQYWRTQTAGFEGHLSFPVALQGHGRLFRRLPASAREEHYPCSGSARGLPFRAPACTHPPEQIHTHSSAKELLRCCLGAHTPAARPTRSLPWVTQRETQLEMSALPLLSAHHLPRDTQH